jgi:hypothetical protein
MSVHPHGAPCLLILCAVTAGCDTSAQPNSDTERPAVARTAAPSKKAAADEAAKKKAAEQVAAQVKAAEERRAAQVKAAEEKRAAEEERAAQVKAAEEKRAAQVKAAADNYAKIKVEVELRGVLSYADNRVAIREDEWVLDFGDNKEMDAKAKGLDGKTVLVIGSAIMHYETRETRVIRSQRLKLGNIGDPPREREFISVWDVERIVAVKSLVAATKE